jgi:hypothetical protein
MPYRARTTDPETSHQAQDRVFGVEGLKADILHLFRLYGTLTDDALIAAHTRHGMVSRTPQRIRTARAELVKDGDLEWSGVVGQSRGGHPSRMWRIVQPPVLFEWGNE